MARKEMDDFTHLECDYCACEFYLEKTFMEDDLVIYCPICQSVLEEDDG